MEYTIFLVKKLSPRYDILHTKRVGPNKAIYVGKNPKKRIRIATLLLGTYEYERKIN